jgi:hypothetical protein
MTATAHAIIGTVIAAKVGNPVLAVPIALASHIIADAIPHWDTATNLNKKGRKKVIADSVYDLIVGFVLSYLLILFLFPETSITYALIIILVSQGLDWLMVPYRLFNINFFLFRWSYKFQKLFDNSLDKPWGIINHIAVLVIIVILAKVI